MKLYIYIFFLLQLSGCMQNEHSFINEINSLDKPKSFEQVLVNDVVIKYLPIGSNKNTVIAFLQHNAFQIITQKENSNCPSAEVTLLGTHDFESNPILPAKYRLVGFFCISDNKLQKMNVNLVKHNF